MHLEMLEKGTLYRSSPTRRYILRPFLLVYILRPFLFARTFLQSLFVCLSDCLYVYYHIYIIRKIILYYPIHSYKCQTFFVSLRRSQTCGGTKGGSLSCTRSARVRKPCSHSYKCQPFFVALRACVPACVTNIHT